MEQWEITAGGSTIGQSGPEGGFIERDESTARGLRILLETEPSRSFYSVTCFIPDWLVHPRFFDSREAAEAAYAEMRIPLEELAGQIPELRPPPAHPDTYAAGQKLAAFTVRFP